VVKQSAFIRRDDFLQSNNVQETAGDHGPQFPNQNIKYAIHRKRYF